MNEKVQEIQNRIIDEMELTLVNEEKLHRVLYGIPTGKDGSFVGALGEDASLALIVAHYDKTAGLITKNGDTVKCGSFWDFKLKAPRKEPQVEFIYRVNGREVIVPEGQELPGIVKAARILADEDTKAAAEEAPKPKKHAVSRRRK